MFKNFIAFMMIVSIFTGSASASTQSGLKNAFNELNFALTVEWDQKDKAFYADQMKKFSATLRDLQSKGLTNSQLVDFVKSEIKNEKAAKDLQTAFTMVQINKMAPEEASKYMVEAMKKSYSVGASFNGEAVVYVAIGILIVAAAIVLVAGGRPANTNNGCYYQTECYDVYDAWGWYMYTECYEYCY